MNCKMRLSSLSLYIAVGASLLAAGCTRPKPETIREPVADLSSLMRDYGTLPPKVRQDSLNAYLPEISAFMKVVSGEPVTDSMLEAWSASPVVTRFTATVDSVFPTLEPLESDLGFILDSGRRHGLDLPCRRYAAVTYGRPEAVLFVDSVMLVALNHFLGPEFPGYSRWPVYRRTEKSPENLPYALSEAMIATRYPYQATPEESTLLSRMLYEGALAAAKLATVPDATVQGVLGYDAADLSLLTEREGELWRQIIAAGLLYDTSTMTSARFTEPSPGITVLPSAWPARAGRFIGYRIVSSYIKKHPDATLPQLLSPSFYNSSQTLAQASYRPK